MNVATKIGTDAAKTASKRVVQRTAEETGDLIGKKKQLIKVLPQAKQRIKKKKTKEKKSTYQRK